MTSSMRLQSFLSRSGVCSRRAAVALLASKQVLVNGAVVTEAGFRVIPERDSVLVAGKPCTLRQKHWYFLFHKPTHVESTNATKGTRKTTREYLQAYCTEHLFCAGRLDFMSSGLMLYTTDGELTYRLTHPKYHIEKTYVVHSALPMPKRVLDAWQDGLRIRNIVYRLERYEYLHKEKNALRLTLCEGKNREIRVVFAHSRTPIKTLQRVSLGPFSLGTMSCGAVRSAAQPVVREAYRLTGLPLSKN